MPLLPAASSSYATAVNVASASGAAASTDQADPLRAATSVCTGGPTADEPAKTRTVTIPGSPGAVPATPENVGVESLVVLPSAGVVTETLGGVVSTTNVFGLLRPVLVPSLCSARAVYVPSARDGASTENVVPVRVTVSVWTGVAPGAVPA